MKYALLIVLALASSASAQCVNCQVPTPAPQQATYSQVLPLQEITVAERRPSILEGMAIRQQSRQAARRASFARYPSVSATYSAGSTGTPLTYVVPPTTYSLGSTGTPSTTYSLGSTGTPQTAPPVTYSLGSTGTPAATYSAPASTVTYGSTGTPTVAAAPACACVNCNCAPAVFSAPTTAAVPCINCVPAAPITYSVPVSPPSITYSVPAATSVSYSIPASVSYAVPSPVRSVSSNYAIALRSATERAMRGIKGHLSSIERQAGKRVGVGWSSHNPNPSTCFNNLPGDYAVARGRDGYYATKIVY